MKSYLKFLSRNKLYSIIVILGMTISLAFIILLGAFVNKQLNTDSFQENLDRIYLYANEESFDCAFYPHKFFPERYPEIESSTAIIFSENVVAHADEDTYNADVMEVDSTFFNIFTVKSLSGDINSFHDSRYNIVISKTFASLAFGNKNPIGKVITLDKYEDVNYIVCGVIENIKNSILKDADVFISSEWMVANYPPAYGPEMQSWACCASAFLCKENADLQTKEPDMLSWFKENCWIYKPDAFTGGYKTARFIPLKEAYFYTGDAGTDNVSHYLNHGNWRFIRMLLYACLALLFFAIMNYINLTVAQTGFRAKEMATRRLLGTSKFNIILKMIGESTILITFAFVLALLIAEGLSPAASKILGYDFTVMEAMTPSFILLCIAGVIVLGLLSGIIPALTISKFKPIDVMKGSFRTKTKMVYSKLFITVQNIITIGMLIAALTIFLQVRHMIDMPLNYNTDNILVVNNMDCFTYQNKSQIAIFRDELKQLPCVQAVGLGHGTPLNGGNNNTMQYDNGRYVSFQIIKGDSAYFNIFGFKIKKDNYLADPLAKNNVYLNEYALKELKITEDTPNFTMNPNTENECTFTIAGVYSDFKIFGALRENSAGWIINTGTYNLEKSSPWNTIIKTTGDKQEAINEIKVAYKKANPDGIFSGEYYEDLIEDEYVKERQLLAIVNTFTLLAILISALGLLAMSTYYVRQQEKDIAIRKVFGSTKQEILNKLIKTFMRYVAVAFIVAIPIGYYLMSSWLKGYIYRINLYWWIFVLAGLFVMIISYISVYLQSARAANANPVVTIKKE